MRGSRLDMLKSLKITFISLTSLLLLLVISVRLANFYPDEIQEESVTCARKAPFLEKNAKLKVLSWNVQYMAGKNYIFFYDSPDGFHERPSSQDIVATTKRVAEVILKEDPDIVLLQEIDEGAKRTDHKDQLMALLDQLPQGKYPCQTQAFYWKSMFVPHPHIMGSVGMKLVTLSKYKISGAHRHSLPEIPKDLLSRQFHLKRCILESRLPYPGGGYLVVMNTHYDAFAQGTDTMKKQVGKTLKLLASLDSKKIPWLIGGDFNLLPSSIQRERLPSHYRKDYKEKTELKPLIEKYRSLPSLEEATGSDMEKWFTYSPNAGKDKIFIDRTIDYIFFSPRIKIGERYVQTSGTLDISDHMPLVSHLEIQ